VAIHSVAVVLCAQLRKRLQEQFIHEIQRCQADNVSLRNELVRAQTDLAFLSSTVSEMTQHGGRVGRTRLSEAMRICNRLDASGAPRGGSGTDTQHIRGPDSLGTAVLLRDDPAAPKPRAGAAVASRSVARRGGTHGRVAGHVSPATGASSSAATGLEGGAQ